jgi:hypothetical protein
MAYQIYNTGDQIWTAQRHGKQATVKVITHDGIVWEEGDESARKLTGSEKIAHQVQVFFTKLILKALA